MLPNGASAGDLFATLNDDDLHYNVQGLLDLDDQILGVQKLGPSNSGNASLLELED